MTPTAVAAIAALGAGAVVVAAADVAGHAHGQRVRRRRAVDPNRSWLPVPRPARRAFRQAGIDDPERAVALWLAAIALSGVLAVAATGGILLLLAVLIGPPIALHLAGGRLDRRRAEQLPDALDAVAAGLRGGLGLAAAIEGAAAVGEPLGPELAAIGRQVHGGRPLEDALERWRAARGDAGTALAGAALGVAAAVGGPGARAVDGAAASLRDRLAADAEADALATQAKASAGLLTAAPLVFAGMLASLDPTAGRFLLGTPTGWACIAAGLLLDTAGATWMAWLVRRSR